jgi:cytochrome c oxidase assembly protein subunit 15
LAVVFQGVLGGLRVVWLKDEIGVFHATLAQLFFVLTCALALFTSKWWNQVSSPLLMDRKVGRVTRCAPIEPSDATCGAHGVSRLTNPLDSGEQQSLGFHNLRVTVLVTTLLIFGQLILGSAMRHEHAGLAIPDFPMAYGKLWPAMDADSVARYNQQRVEVEAANPITAFQIGLQMVHRLVALLILIGVGTVAWRARRWGSRFCVSGGGDNLKVGLQRLAFVWLGLILVQIALGAWTIWSNKAADVATLHVLVGALSLVTGALLCIICFRRSPSQSGLKFVPANARDLDKSSFEGQPTVVVSN